MTTTIIIPSIATNKELRKECLEHIERFSKGEDYEVKFVENIYDGFPRPVNKGIINAGMNDVIIMNDDLMINEEKWITKLRLRAYSNDKIAAVTASTSLHHMETYKTKYGEITFCHGGWNPIYIKREALNKIGYLDEGFYLYFHETDWAIRCHLAGYTTVWDELKADHLISKTITTFINGDKMFEISQKRLKEKWGIP